VQILPKWNPDEEQQDGTDVDQPFATEVTPALSVPAPAISSPAQSVRYQEFEFPGVLAAIPEYRDRLMEFVTQQSIGEGDQIDILVALQEALANAALHGCKDDPSRKILCAVTASPVEIVISVRDPGPGFNMERADPERFETTRLSHGRGIALMRGLMTDVSFARNGAEIILRKKLASIP
jgi:serine/threonine-protein kinase RsbW